MTDCPAWVRKTITDQDGSQVEVVAACDRALLPGGWRCKAHANKRDYR
jgi:hypothetical protein